MSVISTLINVGIERNKHLLKLGRTVDLKAFGRTISPLAKTPEEKEIAAAMRCLVVGQVRRNLLGRIQVQWSPAV